MLSSFELNLSVAPANVKPLLDPEPVWGGAVAGAPLQVGVKSFQSMQPSVSIARLPSASSKPEASAIVCGGPLSPQPVEGKAASSRLAELEVEPKAGKSEELEAEGAACPEARETRDACPWARESEWVELMALRAAEASPARCCATWRPEAEPRVSSETTTRATIAVAPTTLRRRHGRPKFLPVLICALLPSLVGRSTLLAQPLALP